MNVTLNASNGESMTNVCKITINLSDVMTIAIVIHWHPKGLVLSMIVFISKLLHEVYDPSLNLTDQFDARLPYAYFFFLVNIHLQTKPRFCFHF